VCQGKPRKFERDYLFSRAGTVQELLEKLCASIEVDVQSARLWKVREELDVARARWCLPRG
jgi:hypothetical protein